MNKAKALRILGLSEPFTKEDLIKRYRILAKENHPDYHPEKTQIMQEINFAKEYLEKNYDFSVAEFEDYKKQKLEEFKKFILLDMSDYSECFSKFNGLNNDKLNFITSFSKVYDKKEFDSLFNSSILDIKGKYKSLELDYFKENYIDSINVYINYDCSVQSFYDKLLKIKYTYSREIQFNKKITQEVQKYASYNGYSIFASKIEEEKEKIVLECKNCKYKNQDNYINKFNQKIESLFTGYFSVLNDINTMEDYFKSMHSNEILTLVYSLYNSSISIDEISKNSGMSKEEIEIYCKLINFKNSFLKSEYFTQEFELSLNNIKIEYNNLRKVNDLKLNQAKIIVIYNRLLNNYHRVLSSLNPLENFREKEKMSDILKQVFEIFELVKNGKLGIDSLYMLENITFTNLENDNKLLSEVKSNIFTKDNSINIYIDYTNMQIEVLKDDKTYIFLSDGSVHSMPTRTFNNCITIDEYLSIANYIGLKSSIVRSYNKYVEVLDYLYEYCDFIFFKDQNGTIRFTNSKNAPLDKYFIQKITDLSNKDEFLNVLSEQLNSAILEFEEKQNRKR